MKPRTFSFVGRLRRDIGIDLGTAHTRLASPGDGILVDEPSFVATHRAARSAVAVTAVGHQAKLLARRTADTTRSDRPVRHGAIADHELCALMLRAFLRKAAPGSWRLRPRALVALPAAVTAVERQALLSTVARAGAGSVALVHRSIAAALAIGLPITEPAACMTCDLGAGTTEISILCLNEIVARATPRVAGDDLDLAIADFLRRELRVSVAPQIAEQIKLAIGSAVPTESRTTHEVCARDLVTGLPRRITLDGDQVRHALEYPLRAIVDAVARAIEACPAALVADLMDNGMVLVGGGAQLNGLDRRLADATGMPVRVADEPQLAVARGLAICLSQLELWQDLFDERRAG